MVRRWRRWAALAAVTTAVGVALILRVGTAWRSPPRASGQDIEADGRANAIGSETGHHLVTKVAVGQPAPGAAGARTSANQVDSDPAASHSEPSDSARTAPAAPTQGSEHGDYSQYDAMMNANPPLVQVGLPRPFRSTALAYRPTDADRRRIEALEAEVNQAVGEGLLTHAEPEGFERMPMPGEDEVVYVDGSFAGRYRELLAARSEIHERSMQPVQALSLSGTPMKRYQPDGFTLEYYRRKDGALIRSVTKPGEPFRKWVISWTSADPGAHGIPRDVMQRIIDRDWRAE